MCFLIYDFAGIPPKNYSAVSRVRYNSRRPVEGKCAGPERFPGLHIADAYPYRVFPGDGLNHIPDRPAAAVCTYIPPLHAVNIAFVIRYGQSNHRRIKPEAALVRQSVEQQRIPGMQVRNLSDPLCSPRELVDDIRTSIRFHTLQEVPSSLASAVEQHTSLFRHGVRRHGQNFTHGQRV